MLRVSRIAVLLGGLAAIPLAATSARADDPYKPSTGTSDRDKARTGQTGQTGESGTVQGTIDTSRDRDRTATGYNKDMTKSEDDRARFLDRDITDSELANKIHAVNQHEIDMAKMAISQAMNKDVKDFANRLLKDHQDADKKLVDVTKKMGIDLRTPAEAMDAEHQSKMQAKIDELRSKTGLDFDRHFLIAMQKGHDDAILVFTAQAFGHPVGKDLRDYVKKSLGTLNDHRKKSIDLLEKLADKAMPAS
jgi:putative membrane protein